MILLCIFTDRLILCIYPNTTPVIEISLRHKHESITSSINKPFLLRKFAPHSKMMTSCVRSLSYMVLNNIKKKSGIYPPDMNHIWHFHIDFWIAIYESTNNFSANISIIRKFGPKNVIYNMSRKLPKTKNSLIVQKKKTLSAKFQGWGQSNIIQTPLHLKGHRYNLLPII